MQLSLYIEIAFTRRKLGPFFISVSNAEDVLFSIKEKLLEYGLKNVNENEFYTQNKIPLNKENILNHIVNNTLFVIYNNLVAPYGAYEYGREDGMLFFFHTSETPHKHFPHIHVRYSGEIISIYLPTLKTEGKFSNKKIMKRALAYVKINQKAILKKWNEIIGNPNF